jgi:hypothetical protein
MSERKWVLFRDGQPSEQIFCETEPTEKENPDGLSYHEVAEFGDFNLHKWDPQTGSFRVSQTKMALHAMQAKQMFPTLEEFWLRFLALEAEVEALKEERKGIQ